jgi:hypothetical protein
MGAYHTGQKFGISWYRKYIWYTTVRSFRDKIKYWKNGHPSKGERTSGETKTCKKVEESPESIG